VLGANGRSGRGIARRLRDTGQPVVLAGRYPTRLAEIAASLPSTSAATVASGSFEALLAQIQVAAPAPGPTRSGPVARTSMPVFKACPPGTTSRSEESSARPTRSGSLNARYRRSVRARARFPNEQAALKCLYMATRSLDPTGKGRARWTMRWKLALNAFAITFEGRITPSSNRP